MNRETERRIEELGNSITGAIKEIMDMDIERPIPTPVEEREDECLSQPNLVEWNKAHYQPEISSVNNGFIVRMGCQQFVFETYDKMSKYLKMYFEDPNGTESKFHTNELFK